MTAALISLRALVGRLLPHGRLIALALAALSLMWLGWHARSLVAAAEQGRQLREAVEARRVAEERAAAVSREAEGKMAKLRQTNRELTRRAAHETTKPDYRTRLPDAGRLLYNAACCGAGPGQPDPALPAADPAP